MGQTLYLECDSGISGDMVAGALIDLGASTEGLGRVLQSLPLDGFTTRIRDREANGIVGCDFLVELDEGLENHDHDMGYLYGFEGDGTEAAAACTEGPADAARPQGVPAPGAGVAHDGLTRLRAQAAPAPDPVGDPHGDAAGGQDGWEYDGQDAHDAHGGAHHEHRTLSEVVAVVDASALSPRAKAFAVRVFEILAEAEAKAHGTTRDEVHLHEVGAVDSIVDVVTCAFCLDDLDVESCVVSPLAEGWGQVRCAHGIVPVPVPAVANIVASSGLVLRQAGRKGELVTPTGAAVAAAARTAERLPESFRVLGVGVGTGKRAYDPVSMVRAFLVEEAPAATPPSPGAVAPQAGAAPAGGGQAARGQAGPAAPGTLVKLETEMDDCTGEAMGHVIGRLLGAGALEAHFLPCVMKKGRPGWQLQALCREGDRAALERIVFEDTTTIGIRRTTWDRTALPRERVTLATPLGDIEAKRVTLPSGATRTYPEYESVARAAREHEVGFEDAWQEALAAARASQGSPRR